MIELAFEFLTKLTVLFCVPPALVLAGRLVSADMRSRTTVVLFASALLLPIAILQAPDVTVASIDTPYAATITQFSNESVTPANANGTTEPVSNTRWYLWAALLAFLLMTLAMVARVIARLIRVSSVRQSLDPVREPSVERLAHLIAEQSGIRNSFQVKQHELGSTPFVFGWRYPILAVPAGFSSWSKDEQWAALRHELAHIQRGDYPKHLFIQLAGAVFWWHPLACYAARRYRSDIEQACDDLVVREGMQVDRYARLILDLARQSPQSRHEQEVLAIPMAAATMVRLRIKSLLRPAQRRNSMSKLQQKVLMFAALGGLYALGSVQVSAAQPDDRRYMPIFKAVPEYPQIAQEQRIEGFVLVEFDVGENGKPRNIRVVDQSPDDGTFESAALKATERFRYLPERQNGVNVEKRGIRNRLTFSLNPEGQIVETESDFDELARSSETARESLQEKLYLDIEAAEEQEDGDQFMKLAKIALSFDPGVAEYLIVRAGQLGTTNPNELRLIGGMVLHSRGAYADAIKLFSSVTDDAPSQKETADRWITYLEREIDRTEVVRSTLLGLTE